MVDAWAPRSVRLKRRVRPGDSTIQVYSSFSPPGGMQARLGTELVTVTGAAGDTWSLAAPVAENHHADGYLTEVTIKVVVNGVDQSGKAQHLKHKEEAPKGEVDATWDIFTRSPATYTPNMDGLPVPFRLYSNESGSFVPFFGGYMGRVADAQRPNGFHELNLTGRGGFITAGWLPITSSTTWAADVAEHTLVQDVLASYDAYISNSAEHIIDGGLQIGEPFEGIGKKLRDILDFVVGRGDADGQMLDWFVRTDPDDIIKLWLILRGRNPTVEIPISSLRAPVRFVKDYEHVRNYVMVKYSNGYVDASSAGSGAVRGLYFDYSTRIDNRPLAQQVADLILSHASIIEAISDGQVLIEYPKPVLVDGAPYPLHRLRAGWLAQITGWAGGIPLGPAKQIKQLEADHVAHTVGLNLGKVIEDDLDIGSQYFDKQAKMLGTPGSGLIPLNIAPPEGMPYQVRSEALPAGANGLVGYNRVVEDADIAQVTYNIDGGRDENDDPLVIVAGRQFPEQKVEIGGRLIGFRLTGNDGVRATPGPGTISIAVYHAAAATLPGLGTLITTLNITSDVDGSKNLLEPPAVSDAIVDLIPGDYLVYVVLPGMVLINNVAITALIQRTGGSSRVASTGAATISSQSATRDATTGVVTFTVTTNRPCVVQIEYGKTASYASWSQKTENIQKISQVPVVLASPFHWRAIVWDADKHKTIGADQTF